MKTNKIFESLCIIDTQRKARFRKYVLTIRPMINHGTIVICHRQESNPDQLLRRQLW